MRIRSFREAQSAVRLWLLESAGSDESDAPLPDPTGWRLDDSGFYQSRYEDWIQPHWAVRYWHVARAELAGVVLVYEDGLLLPGVTFGIGCLGLLPAGLYRVEPDLTTPVASGYSSDPTDAFSQTSHDPRLDMWIRQGWTYQALD